jgi:phage FluMu gp28-like protein
MTKVVALLPYQAAWIADRADVKIIEKSRRIGISWTEAADSAQYAARDSGQDVWYIGYNADMALEFIEDVATWSKHYHFAAEPCEQGVLRDEDKDILSYTVKFASGNKVKALSSRPSNLRGKQGRVVIDEAAFHPDLDELIKSAIALLMWGGKVRIISTHNGADNPFNELISDCRSGRKKYSLHRVTFQDALAQGLYKRISAAAGKKWSSKAEKAWVKEIYDHYGYHAAEELDVIPSQSSGVWLPRALIEARMTDCETIEVTT